MFRRVVRLSAVALGVLLASAATAYASAPRQSEDLRGSTQIGTVTTTPDVEIGTPTSVTRVDETPPDVDVAGRTAEREEDGGDVRWALLAIPVGFGAWVVMTVIVRMRAQHAA